MTDIQKIIIFGFPHCGTTILRSIIGHSTDVYDIINEVQSIKEDVVKLAREQGKKYILCKWPFMINYKAKMYDNYIKIFIIRNPYYVMSSVNRRFKFDVPNCHSFNKYKSSLRQFLDDENMKIPNLYTIRYEDMFDNNFELLREIFDNIGFEYNDTLFDNKLHNNYVLKRISTDIKEKPKDHDHGRYRSWQINKDFQNMNTKDKLDLTKDQFLLIFNDPIVKQSNYKII